jgi:hypothetical protein
MRGLNGWQRLWIVSASAYTLMIAVAIIWLGTPTADSVSFSDIERWRSSNYPKSASAQPRQTITIPREEWEKYTEVHSDVELFEMIKRLTISRRSTCPCA